MMPGEEGLIAFGVESTMSQEEALPSILAVISRSLSAMAASRRQTETSSDAAPSFGCWRKSINDDTLQHHASELSETTICGYQSFQFLECTDDSMEMVKSPTPPFVDQPEECQRERSIFLSSCDLEKLAAGFAQLERLHNEKVGRLVFVNPIHRYKIFVIDDDQLFFDSLNDMYDLVGSLTSPAYKLMGVSVIFDGENSEVFINGTHVSVEYRFALLVDILYKAGGNWVSGPELTKHEGLFPPLKPGRKPPKNRHPDRVVKAARKIKNLAPYLQPKKHWGFRFRVELL
jgi:hypothetical protein